jgi:hypothetical protein
MIVSFNFYYAHPGRADAVLRQRIRASEVRETIAVPYGRVMKRTSGTGEFPDVIWELDYRDVAGHHTDMAARAASAEFEAIRAGMRQLIRRFERPLYEVHGAASAVFTSPQRAKRVTLDWVYCTPEATSDVLAAMAAHLSVSGSDCGRLLRLITPGDLPQVFWQHEGADDAELPAWPEAVLSQAHAVERTAWTVQAKA